MTIPSDVAMQTRSEVCNEVNFLGNVACLLTLVQYERLREKGQSIIAPTNNNNNNDNIDVNVHADVNVNIHVDHIDVDQRDYIATLFPTDYDLLIGVTYYVSDCMLSDQHFGPLRDRGGRSTGWLQQDGGKLKKKYDTLTNVRRKFLSDVGISDIPTDYCFATRVSSSRYDAKNVQVVHTLGLIVRLHMLNRSTRCCVVYEQYESTDHQRIEKKLEHACIFDYNNVLLNPKPNPNPHASLKNQQCLFHDYLHLDTYDKAFRFCEDVEVVFSRKLGRSILCKENIQLIRKVVDGFGVLQSDGTYDFRIKDFKTAGITKGKTGRWNDDTIINSCKWCGLAVLLQDNNNAVKTFTSMGLYSLLPMAPLYRGIFAVVLELWKVASTSQGNEDTKASCKYAAILLSRLLLQERYELEARGQMLKHCYDINQALRGHVWVSLCSRMQKLGDIPDDTSNLLMRALNDMDWLHNISPAQIHKLKSMHATEMERRRTSSLLKARDNNTTPSKWGNHEDYYAGIHQTDRKVYCARLKTTKGRRVLYQSPEYKGCAKNGKMWYKICQEVSPILPETAALAVAAAGGGEGGGGGVGNAKANDKETAATMAMMKDVIISADCEYVNDYLGWDVVIEDEGGGWKESNDNMDVVGEEGREEGDDYGDDDDDVERQVEEEEELREEVEMEVDRMEGGGNCAMESISMKATSSHKLHTFSDKTAAFANKAPQPLHAKNMLCNVEELATLFYLNKIAGTGPGASVKQIPFRDKSPGHKAWWWGYGATTPLPHGKIAHRRGFVTGLATRSDGSSWVCAFTEKRLWEVIFYVLLWDELYDIDISKNTPGGLSYVMERPGQQIHPLDFQQSACPQLVYMYKGRGDQFYLHNDKFLKRRTRVIKRLEEIRGKCGEEMMRDMSERVQSLPNKLYYPGPLVNYVSRISELELTTLAGALGGWRVWKLLKGMAEAPENYLLRGLPDLLLWRVDRCVDGTGDILQVPPFTSTSTSTPPSHFTYSFSSGRKGCATMDPWECNTVLAVEVKSDKDRLNEYQCVNLSKLKEANIAVEVFKVYEPR